jgi:hypothetical protein
MSVIPTPNSEHYGEKLPWRGHPLSSQPYHQTNERFFSNSRKNKEKNQVNSKNKEKQEGIYDEGEKVFDNDDDKAYYSQQQLQIRMNDLHHAAKRERVLSACDFWWSKGYLKVDEFMRKTLLDHAGWMPIYTLLTFPKFQYWTNEKVLLDAFSSTGGRNYLLSFDERLWDPSGHSKKMPKKHPMALETSTAPSRTKFAGNDAPQNKDMMEGKGFEKGSHGVFDDEEEDDLSDSEELPEITSTNDNDDNTDENSPWNDDLDHSSPHPTSSLSSRTSSGNTIGETAWKSSIPSENAEAATQCAVQNRYDLQADEDDWPHLSWSDEDDDDASGTQYLQSITDQHRDRESNNVDDDADDLPDNQSNKLASIADDKIDDDFKDFPRIWKKGDNIPYDISNAFVKRKNVNVATIMAIEEEKKAKSAEYYGEYIKMAKAAEEPNSSAEYYDEYMKMGQWNPYPWEVEEEEEIIRKVHEKEIRELWKQELKRRKEEEMQKPMKKELKRKKIPKIEKYSTNRCPIEITHPDQISMFCDTLIKSIQIFALKNKNNPKARAIGFDVEYGSLDCDLRLLPAMIQLSSPEENDFVGLLWIDKFPDHGRDMLSDKECAPLMSLLSDSSIAKVGVGASEDAKHLAEWWGVDDPEFVDHFIKNMINLENEFDDRINQKSLNDMAKLVLNRDLPKLKDIRKKAGQREKKLGLEQFIPHWRRPYLTGNMTNCAVSDAACSIDVWLHINGIISQ